VGGCGGKIHANDVLILGGIPKKNQETSVAGQWGEKAGEGARLSRNCLPKKEQRERRIVKTAMVQSKKRKKSLVPARSREEGKSLIIIKKRLKQGRCLREDNIMGGIVSAY